MTLPNRKPEWLRIRLPGGTSQQRIRELEQLLSDSDLQTVCKEARCPNIFECWSAGTATIMILGETCTRACRFCAVRTGQPGGIVDPREPEHTARALAKMDLAYVVITMVDRDDIPDGGAAHVAQTVRRVKEHSPNLLLETLVGDFQGMRQDVDTVVIDGRPDVFAHNVEVVPSLQRSIRDARCSWQRSIDVLRWAKEAGDGERIVTKSSLMVGIGEEEPEILAAMEGLREVGVDVLTIGQYLQPTKKHAPVVRYVTPAEFEHYREKGLAMGFQYVASGPLVRSSYKAAEAFLSGVLRESGEMKRSDSYGRKKHLRVVE
ncbi:MAG: lipoyl synthase [Myxococcota bacterium]